MFRRVAAVSPLRVSSAQSSRRRNSSATRFVEDIWAASPSHSFSAGNPLTALFLAIGLGTFGVTYGYNIAVPVMEAYAAADDNDGAEGEGAVAEDTD